MVDSDAQKNGNNVPPGIQRKPKFRKSILYSIIAVIVVVIVVVSVVVVLPYFTGPHFGFISLSTAQKFTNTTLSESEIILVNLTAVRNLSNSLNFTVYIPIKEEVLYFNSTSSTGRILIMIAQFSNNSLPLKLYSEFFDSLYEFRNYYTSNLNNVSYSSNLTFEGFYYFYAYTFNESFGAGYKGSFFFVISNEGIHLNNFNAFMQAQISAMS